MRLGYIHVWGAGDTATNVVYLKYNENTEALQVNYEEEKKVSDLKILY
jgi:hypothetical protein